MKKIKLIAPFLSFVLMMPVVTSILEVNDSVDCYELTEQNNDNEERGKRKSESKDELDENQKFLSSNKDIHLVTFNTRAKHYLNMYSTQNFSADVLTPPPEFS